MPQTFRYAAVSGKISSILSYPAKIYSPNKPFFCSRMARALLETPNSAAIAQNFLKIILSKMEWILSILFTPNKLTPVKRVDLPTDLYD